MTLMGLDMNATRLRAVHGPLAEFALPCPLSAGGASVPTVFSLEQATPELGAAGTRLACSSPYLTAHNFLIHLGEPRRWKHARHDWDAADLVGWLWRQISAACKEDRGIVLALPSYVSRWQADLIRSIGERCKLPVLGSVPSPLAAALAGAAQQLWQGTVLAVDLDEHALTIGLVRSIDHHAHLLEARQLPNLGWQAWKRRLLDCLADVCVRQSRRDPRESAQAEQGLYEQLDPLIDACRQGRMVHLTVSMPNWLQNLVIQPEQTLGFAAPMVQAVLRETRALLEQLQGEEVPTTCLLTADAARLPGLGPWMLRLLEGEPAGAGPTDGPHLYQEDFGEDLLFTSGEERPTVAILGADGPARAAHGLAAHFQRGDLPPGHLELVAPLPLPQSVEAGPPRLFFLGEDFYLDAPSFCLGSQLGCHLAFDGVRYPSVAPRHCEILSDHHTCVLFNRCRDGTLVNDLLVHSSVILHAGDRIRLGTHGPIVRFLGQGRAS